jgi:hypothetical protein
VDAGLQNVEPVRDTAERVVQNVQRSPKRGERYELSLRVARRTAANPYTDHEGLRVARVPVMVTVHTWLV